MDFSFIDDCYLDEGKMILFTSNKELNRAENIKATMDAYDGKKTFICVNPYVFDPRLSSKEYQVRVTDEFVGSSPGKCIMIGHGISGGKFYGLDQPNAYHRKENARLLDYVVTTSKHMIPLVAKQSGVSADRVLPLGMPRTDAYFGKNKGDGNTVLKDKRSYLFAPTFRAREEMPLETLDWQYIDDSLGDDELFVVKPHMVTKSILPSWMQFKHIIEIGANEPSADYLIDCDVLITDYSSIMFDAHILQKPVVLFDKDTTCSYLQTRGMYLKYPYEYASRYCSNERDLMSIIKDADVPGKEDIACRKLTCEACDGHSAERVADLIKRVRG